MKHAKNLDASSFVALVALLYFFCKHAVFHYEGSFIATVKASPNGGAVKDKKVDVRGTAFWTELPSPQDALFSLGSIYRLLEVPLLLPQVAELTKLELFSLFSAQWALLFTLELLIIRAFDVRTSP